MPILFFIRPELSLCHGKKWCKVFKTIKSDIASYRKTCSQKKWHQVFFLRKVTLRLNIMERERKTGCEQNYHGLLKKMKKMFTVDWIWGKRLFLWVRILTLNSCYYYYLLLKVLYVPAHMDLSLIFLGENTNLYVVLLLPTFELILLYNSVILYSDKNLDKQMTHHIFIFHWYIYVFSSISYWVYV